MDFRKKKARMPNSIKIHPLRVELFCADRQTDVHDETNSRFSQFSERAKQSVQAMATHLLSDF
jgi:hypothetical protein